MLNLIYGPIGSGKTYASDTAIFEALKSGKKVTLIVPEQEAIESENRIFERAMKEGVLLEKLSVVSFRRLANLAFRTHGGLEYNAIGTAGKLIIIYKVISELSNKTASEDNCLRIYTDAQDRSLVELMYNVCEEFLKYSVSLDNLNEAIRNASGTLADKLHDINEIYKKYHTIISSEHTDSTTDVERLAEIYEIYPPSKDEIFFIDSFNGFTVPELAVIRSLIKNSNVTITENKSYQDKGKCTKIGYKTINKTEEDLIRTAYEVGVTPKTVLKLERNSTSQNDFFGIICDKLFDFSYNPTKENAKWQKNVRLVSCEDRFAQAELIACSILSKVRRGARFKDFAVITRNADRYEGVLDVVFEKYGIPLFMSQRDTLTKTAIYKAISSVLEIISDGYRTEDILAYIKSGVCDIEQADIDLLESYVSLWNINRGRWLDDEDWLMNTQGFTSIVYADNTEKLKRINAIRRKIILPIIELGYDIQNTTAKEACKSLYDFIANKSSIAEYYKKTTKSANVTAYNTFIDMLSTLANIGNDIPVTPSRLSSLLYLMAKNTDYGSIPTTFDRVIAGDAAAIRCNGIKHVFLTDCENGSFPASVNEDTFFSDVEKVFLSKHGVKISPCINDANDEEAFYFLRAACGATESITATVCENKGNLFESIGFQRLHAIFPKNKVVNYSANLPEYNKIQSVSTLKSAINSLNNIRLSQISKAYSGELGIDASRAIIPISDPIANITPEEANGIFLKNDSSDDVIRKAIKMSYSSFEAFAKCPFSYFCKYELGLKEKKHNFFMGSDMGSHIHKILEISIKKLFQNVDRENGKKVSDITDDDVSAAVDQATKEVLIKILGQSSSSESKRFEALMHRMKRTITFVTKNTVDEFKCSKFRPKFFELYIGDKGKDKISIPQIEFATDDGTKIKVVGSIDRVDTYLEPKQENSPDDKDTLYVRIVDYKSSVSSHSVNNIKYGVDMQMFIYLFSIWKSSEGEKEFKNLLKLSEDVEIKPAGLLYQPIKLKPAKTSAPIDSQTAYESASAKMTRTGVILNDDSVINAMEDNEDKKFIGGSEKVPSFDDFLTTIKQKMKEIGEKMQKGYACASPLNNKSVSACKYCSLYPICRSKNSTFDEVTTNGKQEK